MKKKLHFSETYKTQIHRTGEMNALKLLHGEDVRKQLENFVVYLSGFTQSQVEVD